MVVIWNTSCKNAPFELVTSYQRFWNCYGPGNLGSIQGRVIRKTLKMVLNTSLLDTQQYKERIKGKVGKFREKSSALIYTSM